VVGGAGIPAEEDITFASLVPQLPPDYRPLVGALVEENNHLLVRVQQRARQNHLLLSRSLEMMQSFLNTLMPGVKRKFITITAICTRM